jgi:DNA-binding transcriptional MocR family regulator
MGRLPEGVRDLESGNPAAELLPAFAGQASPGERIMYGSDSVFQPLADLASKCVEEEGIRTDHLLVTHGAMDGVERVLGAHLLPGDEVAVESPGYNAVIDLVRAMGLRAVAVDVDEDGIVPESLRRACSGGVAAVVVTPRAQNPTGAAITQPRSIELRTVLADYPDILVVEDDHAGPIAGQPLHSLTDGRRTWAFIRSVSKWLGPDLRVAIVYGDETTVSRAHGRQHLGPGWVSIASQRAVHQLWSNPGTPALLDRARDTYAHLRSAAISAAENAGLRAWGRSGLNVWIYVPDEDRAIRELLSRGISVLPGSRFRVKAGANAIRVTVASMQESDVAALREGLTQLSTSSVTTRYA